MPDYRISSRYNSLWHPLYFLNIYRIFISCIYTSFYFFNFDLPPFASLSPKLFQLVSLAYLLFSILLLFSINKQWPSYKIQTKLQILIDILVVLLLMHASGGVSSGVGLLMIIPVVAGGFFFLKLLSYFFAALASILILLDQLYLHFHYGLTLDFPQAGILGMILFISALTSNYLIDKLKDSENLAQQRGEDLISMENLASFVMQRLKNPIMVINENEKIQLRNDAAIKICHVLNRSKQDKLSDFSKRLSNLYMEWKNNPQAQFQSFKLEGSEIEVLPHFSRLTKSDDSNSIVVLEDLSELKQQSLQQKLASLGRLSASIAHEIRNPLAAITHASELLAESTELNQQEKRLTEIIDKQSQRLNKIIDTVLNLSRKQSTSPQKIELNDWLNNFKNEHLHYMDSSIQWELKTESSIQIYFDPHHLQQILNNLIQNAIKHCDKDNSEIVIRSYQNSDIYIDVINNGEGITDENKNNLFEPFFTTHASGTGLGLYMARELANMNQAKLNYLPLENNYSCFQLKIMNK